MNVHLKKHLQVTFENKSGEQYLQTFLLIFHFLRQSLLLGLLWHAVAFNYPQVLVSVLKKTPTVEISVFVRDSS